jgi:DNA-binding response OmpR family regulator
MVQAPSQVPRTILVIDDDPHTVEIVARRLQASGYAALKAYSAAEGLDWLARERVDLALLNLNMPGVGGLELCEQMQATPRWRTIPVVVITARHDPDLRQRAAALGVKDVLAKPFAGQELLRCVREHLPATLLS